MTDRCPHFKLPVGWCHIEACHSSTITGDDFKREGLSIELRVDLTVDQTQKVFDRILTKLGHIAPPVLGFRMQKGDELATDHS
ncbi:hypothetical protein JHK85_028611 [Glycine max]|nr:hypothetical protein JHK85_028611 [Glycine max]KAG5003935.1 hypothetical protein JHK86_028074 [Glycine max]